MNIVPREERETTFAFGALPAREVRCAASPQGSGARHAAEPRQTLQPRKQRRGVGPQLVGKGAGVGTHEAGCEQRVEQPEDARDEDAAVGASRVESGGRRGDVRRGGVSLASCEQGARVAGPVPGLAAAAIDLSR